MAKPCIHGTDCDGLGLDCGPDFSRKKPAPKPAAELSEIRTRALSAMLASSNRLREPNMTDLAPPEIAAMTMMRCAAKDMPDDMQAIGALQELACLYAKIEPLLTDPMRATFIGAGAYVAKQAEMEMKAQVQAFTMLARLSKGAEHD